MLLLAFRNTQKQIVASYYPIEAVPQPDDNDMCMMRGTRIREIATNIYNNRFAFSDLCIGYLIAVVSEKTLSNFTSFSFVMIATGVITYIENYIAGFLAKRNFPEDMQVPASKLEELGVNMTASNRAFYEMLDEVFGESR